MEALLQIALRNPSTHARWLNTFSLLEMIGFRKIVSSQRLEPSTLQHALEEGRHALMLKRWAIRLGGLEFETYDDATLYCQREALSYFHGIDDACSSLTPRLNYFYVTWIVERRALEVYRAYLATPGSDPRMSRLIREEDLHLATMEKALREEDPNFAERSRELLRLEAALYTNFVEGLERELA